ncbi:MAG TPA: glycosyl transferase [Microbacterium sp.]|uniref:macrolide family glycosyltransferase n=1 Tax=Microbacterium sp. TaxID=51671 RepID=UPI000ED68510|nr:glycosyl transferase [Microbacterium sp.]
MSRIVFMGPHGHGHITPMLGLAAELVARGHEVIFAAPEEYEKGVVATGAGFHRVSSLWESLDAEDIPQMHGREMVRAMGLLLAETKAMVEQLADLPRPDLVVHDGTLGWWGRILAHRWGIPAVETWPNFVGNKHWNMSSYVRINPFSPRFLLMMLRIGNYLRSEGISDVGAFMQGRLANARIVTMPRSFQPRNETFTGHDFVGPIIADRSFQGAWTAPAQDVPVVLVSLGTAYNNRPEFFRMVAESARGRSWHVVMAIGELVNMDELGVLPANVEVHVRVPQLSVLESANAFVTHAGMGSTLEALALRVPMVALAQMAEQQANADRIRELGLGEALHPQTITPDVLWNAIERVARDPQIARRLSDIWVEIEASGGAKAGANIVDRIIDTVPGES